MSKKWRCNLWAAAVSAALGVCGVAQAQTSTFQPFKGVFASKSTAESKAIDARSLEIQVELAWLADSSTFPYFLEASAKDRKSTRLNSSHVSISYAVFCLKKKKKKK